MAAVVRDLHFPKFRNPATTFHSLAPFHPPIICRANCAALVFLSCRVARSLAPSPLHMASSLGALSPRSTNPVTATSRHRFTPLSRPRRLHVPSLHRGQTRSRRHHAPALHRGHGLSATSVTSLGSGRHGSRVKHLLLCGVLLAHRAPHSGPALAQRIPQDLERVAVRLPDGIGLGQGPCSAQSDLVPSKTSASRPSAASTISGHGTRRPESPA